MITSLFSQKKVGIWGFGKTGQSFLSLITKYQPAAVGIIFKETPTLEQIELAKHHGAKILDYELLPQFLEAYDIILPSQSIDRSPYTEFHHKFISELDLFSELNKLPTIAITGSVGKTTTVTFITKLLKKFGKKALACGNIGFPLLDAVKLQDQYDIFVLELSSQQLEQSTLFAPDYAALTTLFENHLNHHKTMDAYARAKGNLFSFQRPEQHAVIPLCYYDMLWDSVKNQHIQWVAPDHLLNIIHPLSDITALQNWQIIFTILDAMGFSLEQAAAYARTLTRPEHRMEFITEHRGVRFYNDSKSTVPQATLQAIQQIPTHSPIILFLGGTSKGVDRQPLCQSLGSSIKHVICFGKEAETLATFCKNADLPATACANLDEAWTLCTVMMQENDTVLFSPSGASYDLFKDYEYRGRAFVQKVKEYVGQQ